MYGRRIQTKFQEFESTEEDGERPVATDWQARYQDAELKQGSADVANKRAMESNVLGDKVLLMSQKENKFSATYDPEPFRVVSKRGVPVIIERGKTLLKRNVGHVKSSSKTHQENLNNSDNQHCDWSRDHNGTSYPY